MRNTISVGLIGIIVLHRSHQYDAAEEGCKFELVQEAPLLLALLGALKTPVGPTSLKQPGIHRESGICNDRAASDFDDDLSCWFSYITTTNPDMCVDGQP